MGTESTLGGTLCGRPLGLKAVRDIKKFAVVNYTDHIAGLNAEAVRAEGRTPEPHWRRQQAGYQQGKLRIPFCAYTPETRKILRTGLFLEVSDENKSELLGECPQLGNKEFTFDRNASMAFFDAMESVERGTSAREHSQTRASDRSWNGGRTTTPTSCLPLLPRCLSSGGSAKTGYYPPA